MPSKSPGLLFGRFKHSQGNRPHVPPLGDQPAMAHMGEKSLAFGAADPFAEGADRAWQSEVRRPP